MIIIKPETVSTAKLISSNVAISDYPAWVSGTNYAIGDIRYYQPVGEPYPHDYEALVVISGADNLIPPSDNPTKWLDLGASKRYKMFDGKVNNGTSNTASIDVTLRMGAIINGIYLVDVVASTIRITVTDAVDGVVYDKTVDLVDLSDITDWYSYHFNAVGERMDEFIFLDLPTYPTADVRILISNGASLASVGEVALGTQNTLGVTNFGTTIGIRNYSRKDIDQFGNFIVVPRSFADTIEYDVAFETANLNSIKKYFIQIKDLPVVVIGDPNKLETIMYGYYDIFSIPISSPTISQGVIRFEGLV